jgi:(p)ppGpp synthase/HD superfamily hydrolase
MNLSPRFESALTMAAQLHVEQSRKGSEIPYVSHLLAVASLVLEHGGTEDQAIAALLHDAPEDQGGLKTLKRIRDEFGETVAEIVDQCTDTYENPKPDWGPRKKAYLAGIPNHSPEARLVSTADKLHNARAILNDYREIGEAVWERFESTKDETFGYYSSALEAFEAQETNSLTAELRRTLEAIKAHSDMLNFPSTS